MFVHVRIGVGPEFSGGVSVAWPKESVTGPRGGSFRRKFWQAHQLQG